MNAQAAPLPSSHPKRPTPFISRAGDVSGWKPNPRWRPAETPSTFARRTGHCRSRAVSGGETIKYRDDRIGSGPATWNVLNEEDGSGNLEVTYVHSPVRQIGTVLATSEGSTASSGTWSYYFQDAIGSTRGLRDNDGERIGKYEYTPFGGKLAESGVEITRKFTGHDWDNDARLYFTAYRYYSPDANRWLTRDPLGMVDGPNVYAYVGNNPIAVYDSLGQCGADNRSLSGDGNGPEWQAAYLALTFLLAVMTIVGGLLVLYAAFGGNFSSPGTSVGICIGVFVAAALLIAASIYETGQSDMTDAAVLGLGMAAVAACVGAATAHATTSAVEVGVISNGIMAQRVVSTTTLGARLIRAVTYGTGIGISSGAAVTGLAYEISRRVLSFQSC